MSCSRRNMKPAKAGFIMHCFFLPTACAVGWKNSASFAGLVPQFPAKLNYYEAPSPRQNTHTFRGRPVPEA